MKILKSWLQDYFSDNISDQRLIDILMSSGLEVEDFVSGIDENVIVAKIIKIVKHPNADKLQIVSVDTGKEKLKIVCGAGNIEVGQLVPLAMPGAKLPTGEISQATIRGVESFGMLCAEDELGISNDHSGIFILSSEYKTGKPLNQYLNSDTIVELDITANRGDCLSHIGVAREIAAFENSFARKEPISLSKIDSKHCSEEIDINVKNPEFCPQYLARVIDNVKIGPSPKWLQDRLIACGAKPINNVVDVTNYILLDLGHPMHAFDLQKISGQKIIVRNAKRTEDIVTLDGEIRNLNSKMLIISDEKEPIAVAGIMGGKNSEVDENTKTIVLEAAEFDPKNIRATAKDLKLSTEASYRFERGIDSGGIEYVINKAANLIAKVSGGRILQGIIQVGEKSKREDIKIEYDKIRCQLGLEISNEEVNHILRLLGFVVNDNFATVPTWRHDISIWQDLSEEVGRVFGYDKIISIQLQKTASPKKSGYYFLEELKDILVKYGFSETMNYPFLSENDVATAKLNNKNLLEIANPKNEENKYLRNSLIPGLLKNVAKNPSFDSIQIFEIGHTFQKTKESISLAFASAGKSTNQQKVVDVILSKLNIKSSDRTVTITEYNRQELENFKIKKPLVCVCEINLSKILGNKKVYQNIKLNNANKKIKYRGMSKFPAVTRDLAFIVDRKVNVENLANDIYCVSNLINRVELFDEFASNKFGKDKKNIAYHIYLQSTEKTLNDPEAEKIINKIIMNIEKKYLAKLRKA